MAQDGEAFIYAIAGAKTGDYLGTGSLVAADVVLAHDVLLNSLATGDRVRVQVVADGVVAEVIDGEVDVVGAGLVLVALDRPAGTPLVALRLGPADPSREEVLGALTSLQHDGGSAGDDRPEPPGPPDPPGPAGEPRSLPGGPGHGGNQQPPWCPFEPTWPGCHRYRL